MLINAESISLHIVPVFAGPKSTEIEHWTELLQERHEKIVHKYL